VNSAHNVESQAYRNHSTEYNNPHQLRVYIQKDKVSMQPRLSRTYICEDFLIRNTCHKMSNCDERNSGTFER